MQIDTRNWKKRSNYYNLLRNKKSYPYYKLTEKNYNEKIKCSDSIYVACIPCSSL